MALVFGSPNGLTSVEKDINGRVLRAYAHHHRAKLGLDPDLPISVPSFHPVFRILENGRMQVEMVVEIIQTRPTPFDRGLAAAGSFPLRGGVTMVVEAPKIEIDHEDRAIARLPEVRFLIGKPISGEDGKHREDAQRHFMLALGLASGDTEAPGHFQANFGLLHEER